MTIDGESALELSQLAQTKGVKTAYAASFRYMPHVLFAKRLVAEGAIGEPQEVECISHFNLEKDIPFGWSHRKEQGGGRLNNNFTHKLSIVTSVIGEKILAVSGEVRDDLQKAPIVKGVHNFVSVLFKHGGLHPRFKEDHIVFYGSQGAIYILGHYGSGPLYHYGSDKQWTELPVPDDIAANIPDVDGDTERNWRYLIREFVNDICGEDVPPYQTFKEGSDYQQLIDIIRKNDRWVDVSNLQKPLT